MIGEELLTRPWTGKLLLLGTPPILLYKKLAIKRQKQAVVSKSLAAIGFSDVELAFKCFYTGRDGDPLSSAALRDDLPNRKRLNHRHYFPI